MATKTNTRHSYSPEEAARIILRTEPIAEGDLVKLVLGDLFPYAILVYHFANTQDVALYKQSIDFGRYIETLYPGVTMANMMVFDEKDYRDEFENLKRFCFVKFSVDFTFAQKIIKEIIKAKNLTAYNYVLNLPWQ